MAKRIPQNPPESTETAPEQEFPKETPDVAPPPEPLDHKEGKTLFRLKRVINQGKSGRADCPAVPAGYLEFREGFCAISLEPEDAERFADHLENLPIGCEYALVEAGEENQKGPIIRDRMSVGDVSESPHHLRVKDNEDYVFHGAALKEGVSPKKLVDLVAKGLIRTIRDADQKEKYHLEDLRKAVGRVK